MAAGLVLWMHAVGIAVALSVLAMATSPARAGDGPDTEGRALVSEHRDAFGSSPDARIQPEGLAGDDGVIPLKSCVVLLPEEKRFLQLALGGLLPALFVLTTATVILRNRLARREKALHAAAAEIRDQKERLDLALKGTQTAVWEYWPQTGKAAFSAEWFATLGYVPDDIPSSFSDWAALTHPDDAESVAQVMDDYIRGGGIGIVETQFRMRTRAGEWRWIMGKGRAVSWNEDGSPSRVIGMNVDIHRQKTVEHELREAEAISSALFSQAFNLFALLDLDGRILRINRSAMNTLRHGQDVLGQCFWEAPWWPDKEEGRRIGKTAMAIATGGDVYWSDAVHISRTGEERYIDFACSALKNEHGQCTFIIAEGRDITEYKSILKTMEKSERRFKSIFDHAPCAIVINDMQNGRFLEVNETFVKSTGFSREEALLMQAWEFTGFSPEQRRDIHQKIREGGVFNLEVESRRFDGMAGHLLFSSVPVPYGEKDAFLSMVLDITDTKRAGLALAESEKKYRDIFNNAPIGIFRSTLDGHFLDANPTLASMFGYENSAHIIREVKDIARDIYPRPQARHTLLEALRRSPEGATMEVEFRRRDGSPLYGVMHASLQTGEEGSPAYLDGTIEDITERKRAEEALKASERTFSELFMLSPDCIVLSNLETGRIIQVNEAFLALLGYDRTEVLGLTRDELGLHSDLRQLEMLTEQVRRHGKFHNVEMQFYHKDGHSSTHLVSAKTIMISGQAALMSISRDVTEMRKIQAMMVQSEKMVSLGGIAAGVAHEINNPLGIIVQAAQNLKQRSRPDFPKNIEAAEGLGLDMAAMDRYMRARKLDEFIDHIQDAAVRASEIITRMLLFSRKSESRRQSCDVRKIIDEAVALARNDYDLKKAYDFKQIAVSIVVEEPVPDIICTETEIEQVILNILRNAAQAMAEASPAQTEPRIDIHVRVHGEFLRMEVHDNGPGMTPDVQKRIMEPFFTTKPPGIGTGLGLSVSYFIITTGHGGHFSASSELGKGTVFVIDLPIAG
jgi:PAS domain S-box-containing protein